MSERRAIVVFTEGDFPDDTETLWADAKSHDCSIDAASLNNALVAAAEALERAHLADMHDD